MLDQPLSRVESPGPGCSEEQRTSHEGESEDQPVDRAHLQVSEYSRTAVGTIGSGGDGYAHLIGRPDSGDNRRNQDWNPSAEALEASPIEVEAAGLLRVGDCREPVGEGWNRAEPDRHSDTPSVGEAEADERPHEIPF